VLVACAHNDLLLDVAAFDREPNPFAGRWLAPLERGGVRVQVCAIYVDARDLPELALRRALDQTRAFLRAVRENRDRVVHVRTASDLDAALHDGRIGLVLALEGAEPLGSDPRLADVFWELGVRWVGLTWMRRNAFADGNAEPGHGGLSRLGRQLVTRLDELGAVVDLAHASDRTFADTLEAAPDASVAVSHAGCRALAPSPRNVPDELLAALAERDGFLGVMCHPFALGAGATVADVCGHVDHALALMGPARVGLGGDFTRQLVRSGGVPIPPDVELPPGQDLDAAVDGLAGPEDYPVLREALAARGLDPATVAAVMGGSLVGFLHRALPAGD
jgi:membrane dipeptidase